MTTADLRPGARLAGGALHARAPDGAAPDYHALGTFSETWTFLEFFLERCLHAAGGEADCDQPLSLQARLDALESLELGASRPEALALAAEVRALALKRQAVLQDLARASLNRLGLNLFALPDAALGPKAVPSPFGRDKALDALHLKTCDLVRRAALLLCALQKARS
ncbi:hypothetical protein [Phenylobacterium sp.]|uniref:hypothetical protein n=1 Tax=Phenylobacterium sp. TaxID=1871053 RepID=UPI00289E0958|nr:hypothetical protein [Phenylobacterium sp.]